MSPPSSGPKNKQKEISVKHVKEETTSSETSVEFQRTVGNYSSEYRILGNHGYGNAKHYAKYLADLELWTLLLLRRMFVTQVVV
jgi:hypothetical protein